jgi:hypothetical protein
VAEPETVPVARTDRPAGRESTDRRPRVPIWRRPLLALGLVAVAYTATQLLAGRVTLPLGWDEIIYVSQFARDAPPADFSPHRSIGMALLVAPVTAITGSLVAIRIYVAVLSGAGLFFAYWAWLHVWRRVRPASRGWEIPLAAGLFGTLWVALFHGMATMPNLPIALCVAAAVALFVQATPTGTGGERPRWPPAAGLAAVFVVLTLLRPTDALVTAAPLLAGGLLLRRWRSWQAAVAIIVGLAAGWTQWLIESYARFGGPSARLRDTAEMNAAGFHFLLVKHLEVLGGNLGCNPGVDCGPVSVNAVVWWSAAAVLVTVALIATRRPGRPVLLLVLAVAGAVSAPYVVFTDYTVPRYLLALYALVALPAAIGLIVLTRARPPFRQLIAVALSALVALHAAVQVSIFHRVVAEHADRRAQDDALAPAVSALGIRPPCLVFGDYAVTVAYHLRCESWDLARRMYTRQELILRLTDAAETGKTVVRLSRVNDTQDFPPGWTTVRITPGHGWRGGWCVAIRKPFSAPPQSTRSQERGGFHGNGGRR